MVLTLYGQGPHYWSGVRDYPNEENPPFYRLLQIGPPAFVAGGAVWMVVFVCLILLLPRRLALWTSLSVAMGHTWGMATWVRTLWPGQSYWICLGMWIGLGGMLAFVVDRPPAARGKVPPGIE